MMERTPEGKKVLEYLRRNGATYNIAIGTSHHPVDKDLKVSSGVPGKANNVTENGANILLFTGSMGGSNAEAASASDRLVWHELYHATEPEANARAIKDPIEIGTNPPKDDLDLMGKVLGHERRATRFSNIVGKRLGADPADVYGVGTSKATPIPDPLGSAKF